MVGRSGAVVSADSSRRQTTLERGSGRHVFVRQSAEISVSRGGARRPGAVVSVRSENDSPGRWATVVHSWSGRRHHGTETGGRRAASGTQCVVGDFGYGGRFGRGARSGRTNHPVQSNVRAIDGLHVARGARTHPVGFICCAGRSGRIQGGVPANL